MNQRNDDLPPVHLGRTLTSSEVRSCLRPYAAHFGDWKRYGGSALIRDHWPIRQMIWLENIRSIGTYRPVHSVATLTPISSKLVFEYLPFPLRMVTLRQHSTGRWQGVIASLERHCRPSLSQPVNLDQTLRHAVDRVEAEGISNPTTLVGVALLSAAIGEFGRSNDWSKRAMNSCLEQDYVGREWIAPVRAFAEQLLNATANAATGKRYLAELREATT